MTLYDYLQLYVITNLFVVIFYSSYATDASPMKGNALSSLLGAILVSILGVLTAIFHLMKNKKDG